MHPPVAQCLLVFKKDELPQKNKRIVYLEVLNIALCLERNEYFCLKCLHCEKRFSKVTVLYVKSMDENERTHRGALTLDAVSLLDHHKSSSSSKEDGPPTPAFDQQEAMTSMSSNDDVTSTRSADEDEQQRVGDDHPKVNYKYQDGEVHESNANDDDDEEEVDGIAFAAHAAAQAISESDAAAARAAAAATAQQQQHSQHKPSPTFTHQGSTRSEASTTKMKKSPAKPTSTPEVTTCSATIPPSSVAHHVAQALQHVPQPQPHRHSAYQHRASAPSTPIPMPVTTSAPIVCRICQRGDEDGRPLLRFLPVEHDMAAAAASPSVITFTQDICLHIFCGKTASILPSVMKPELEILTKAGLKNKHGIGPEVNAALARTRCAILEQEGAKEKHFYLVREFEAHLAAIRHTRISYAANSGSSDMPVGIAGGQQQHQRRRQQQQQQQQYYYPPVYPGSNEYQHHQYHHLQAPSEQDIVQPSSGHQNHPGEDADDHSSTSGRSSQHQQQYGQAFDPSAYHFSDGSNMSDSKIIPVRAAANRTHHYKYSLPSINMNSSNNYAQQHHMASTHLTRDGKVQCACGGTHLPAGTSKGTQSWRSHVMTKRHQKWMEDNGMLNAV